MTLYGNGNNAPIGGPMSPFQGTTPGIAGGATQQLPAGMSLLEAMSRGYVSRNALVNTVNAVSAGGDPSKGGDPATIDQMLSNGNGAQTCRGASIAPAGAINTQIFVDGIASANAALSTGPAPTDSASLVEAPTSAATIASNVAVFANQFGG